MSLPLRHHSSLGGCSWTEAGEVELKLASQTLDALGLQSHDFIQLGHKFFKILRRNNTCFFVCFSCSFLNVYECFAYTLHLHAWCYPQNLEEDIGSPETGVLDGYESPRGC